MNVHLNEPDLFIGFHYEQVAYLPNVHSSMRYCLRVSATVSHCAYIVTPFNFDIGLLAVCLLKIKWFQKNYSLTNLLCWCTVFGKSIRNILICSETQHSKLIWNCSVSKTYVFWKNYWWIMWGNQSILVFFISVFCRREKSRSVMCLLKRIAFSKFVHHGCFSLVYCATCTQDWLWEASLLCITFDTPLPAWWDPNKLNNISTAYATT